MTKILVILYSTYRVISVLDPNTLYLEFGSGSWNSIHFDSGSEPFHTVRSASRVWLFVVLIFYCLDPDPISEYESPFGSRSTAQLTLPQVPSLTEHPPNFLVASELRSHVTPVVAVVVPDLVDDTFETESEFSEAPGPQPDERDRSAGDFRIGTLDPVLPRRIWSDPELELFVMDPARMKEQIY